MIESLSKKMERKILPSFLICITEKFLRKVNAKINDYKVENAVERFKHIENTYGVFVKLQKQGMDIKPFFKVLLGFFKKLFAKFIGFVNSLKDKMDKGTSQWEEYSQSLYLYL